MTPFHESIMRPLADEDLPFPESLRAFVITAVGGKAAIVSHGKTKELAESRAKAYFADVKQKGTPYLVLDTASPSRLLSSYYAAAMWFAEEFDLLGVENKAAVMSLSEAMGRVAKTEMRKLRGEAFRGAQSMTIRLEGRDIIEAMRKLLAGK